MEAIKSFQVPCKVINLSASLNAIPRSNLKNRLVIHEMAAIHLILYSDIIFAKSEGNYTTIYLNDNTQRTASLTLKSIESKLPKDSFYRIHHSILVRVDQLSEIRKSEVVLRSHQVLPVSRRRRPGLLELLT